MPTKPLALSRGSLRYLHGDLLREGQPGEGSPWSPWNVSPGLFYWILAKETLIYCGFLESGNCGTAAVAVSKPGVEGGQCLCWVMDSGKWEDFLLV